jgi:hypothetical protein
MAKAARSVSAAIWRASGGARGIRSSKHNVPIGKPFGAVSQTLA